ncbi:hypothetical protein H9639_12245 [Arthrobacter sp. Sa2CUA1]|uniref:Uncharacterized protein n=1 Tax=Arthrobacter gallicola TaxID=2762225 RepID=A0ABR8UU28_9MICC|nr:hypothetical protein [Arthrobacter gallicola]MBD7996070.1 hypothetical protein [Arthrobacter gallicola]
MLLDSGMLVAGLLGLLLVIFRDKILPARFMGDEGTIQELARGLWSAEGDSSYTQVANFYRWMGLAENATLAGLFGFVLACMPYLLLIKEARALGTSFGIMVTSLSGVLLSAVYMGSYSKEVFLVPIVLALVVLKPGKLSLLLICLPMALYATYFRSYWFFVLTFFVLLAFILRKNISIKRLLLVTICGIAVGSLLLSFILDVPADHFRQVVNVRRAVVGDVNTLIPRFIPSESIFSGPLNNIWTFIVLVVPIPLLLLFSGYYIVIFALLASIWGGFYLGVQRLKNVINRTHGLRITRAIVFLSAFVMTQAFFEPDYGSALKHLTPFIPLFLMIQLGVKEMTPESTSKENR